jgi:long-subunit acyl-CoA synthetase (AMP-forming)
VAPEKIEQIYGLSTLTAQVFVYGDSLKVDG